MSVFKPMLASVSYATGCSRVLGIATTRLVCCALRLPAALPRLGALMGASAVLMFALLASPLAQPWAVIAVNTV